MKFLEHLEPLLLILLGSSISLLGVVYSIRKQWEYVERDRKRKLRVKHESEARVRLQSIKESLFETDEKCKKEIISYNEWFFRSQPYLPLEFNNKWAGLRYSFVQLCQLQERSQQEGSKDKIKKINEHIEKLIEGCFGIIDSRLGVQKITADKCVFKNNK